ncbi:MAG: hypothetical protein VX601_01880 [Pseudomonadota bacterium]|nr:hypothetical protein [Pseudomonadota bacterium]
MASDLKLRLACEEVVLRKDGASVGTASPAILDSAKSTASIVGRTQLSSLPIEDRQRHQPSLQGPNVMMAQSQVMAEVDDSRIVSSFRRQSRTLQNCLSQRRHLGMNIGCALGGSLRWSSSSTGPGWSVRTPNPGLLTNQ